LSIEDWRYSIILFSGFRLQIQYSFFNIQFKRGRKPMALTITCPVCGKRNGYEFRYGGVEKGPRPDEEGLTPANWCDYVHMNECVAGIQKEWWFHRDGCGAWFTIHRDTIANLVVEKPEVN
jgi:sarcosine oxidase subunit delta